MSTSTPTAGGALLALSNELASSVETAGRSVVTVHARQRGASTGVYWRTGVVVAAAHAIQRDEDITLTLPGGRSVPATLAGSDAGTDIAVLKAELELPPAEIAPSSELKVGTMVLALGRDGDGDLSASMGIVSALGGPWRTWRGGRVDSLVRLDLALYPGFSGGPLVDSRGRVAGINTSGLSRSMSVSIPTTTVERVAGELLSKGRIARGFLGLAMQPISLPASLRKSLGVEAKVGLILIGVEPGAAAENAGFLIGDILLKLGGTDVEDPSDVQSQLGPDSVGRSLRASIVRAGALTELDIVPAEWPQR